MHKQGHGKSVPDILMSNVMAEILLIFTCLYTSRYEDRGRDPTSKGPLPGVKCKQRDSYMQEHSFQSFPGLVNRILYKNPAMLLVPLLFSPFPIKIKNQNHNLDHAQKQSFLKVASNRLK